MPLLKNDKRNPTWSKKVASQRKLSVATRRGNECSTGKNIHVYHKTPHLSHSCMLSDPHLETGLPLVLTSCPLQPQFENSFFHTAPGTLKGHTGHLSPPWDNSVGWDVTLGLLSWVTSAQPPVHVLCWGLEVSVKDTPFQSWCKRNREISKGIWEWGF
jgi:hypothetical protein